MYVELTHPECRRCRVKVDTVVRVWRVGCTVYALDLLDRGRPGAAWERGFATPEEAEQWLDDNFPLAPTGVGEEMDSYA